VQPAQRDFELPRSSGNRAGLLTIAQLRSSFHCLMEAAAGLDKQGRDFCIVLRHASDMFAQYRFARLFQFCARRLARPAPWLALVLCVGLRRQWLG
jgi:hypothetical protein